MRTPDGAAGDAVAAGTLIGFKRAHFAPVYFLRSYLKRNTNLAIIEKTREVRVYRDRRESAGGLPDLQPSPELL